MIFYPIKTGYICGQSVCSVVSEVHLSISRISNIRGLIDRRTGRTEEVPRTRTRPSGRGEKREVGIDDLVVVDVKVIGTVKVERR